MYRCPHCGQPGVSFFAKLLCSPILPAVCTFCHQCSTKSGRTVWAQVCIAIAFLATVPNLASSETTYTLGTVTAVIIIGVGLTGPLRKQ